MKDRHGDWWNLWTASILINIVSLQPLWNMNTNHPFENSQPISFAMIYCFKFILLCLRFGSRIEIFYQKPTVPFIFRSLTKTSENEIHFHPLNLCGLLFEFRNQMIAFLCEITNIDAKLQSNRLNIKKPHLLGNENDVKQSLAFDTNSPNMLLKYRIHIKWFIFKPHFRIQYPKSMEILEILIIYSYPKSMEIWFD